MKPKTFFAVLAGAVGVLLAAVAVWLFLIHGHPHSRSLSKGSLSLGEAQQYLRPGGETIWVTIADIGKQGPEGHVIEVSVQNSGSSPLRGTIVWISLHWQERVLVRDQNGDYSDISRLHSTFIFGIRDIDAPGMARDVGDTVFQLEADRKGVLTSLQIRRLEIDPRDTAKWRITTGVQEGYDDFLCLVGR